MEALPIVRVIVKYFYAGEKLLRALFFSLILAVLASAMLVESDAYRFVVMFLVVFCSIFERSNLKTISRDWLSILCYTWAIYTFLRFSLGVLFFGQRGTSEWLYIFPIFFPIVGAALFAVRRHISLAATLLIVGGLTSLLLTLDFRTLIAGSRAPPLFHNNPIHAGVGSCMLFLTSVFWILHKIERGQLRWYSLITGVLTAVLSLAGALGAQSKGAWLALCTTAAFVVFLVVLRYAGERRVHLVGILLLATVAAAGIASPYVEKVAGPTMTAAAKLTKDTVATGAPIAAIQRTIADPDTPTGVRERLMLWSNALELIRSAPLIGWGNSWLQEWKRSTYSDVHYTLIHNGYLEFMVRHGFFGLLFLVLFIVVAAKRINYADRNGFISSSVATYIYSISFFFFCTITTNSNNRLALGESYFIIAGAAVFSITLACRKEEWSCSQRTGDG